MTQKSGTELPGSGEYLHNEDGASASMSCWGAAFASSDSFDSGSGWTSFTRPIHPVNVNELSDTTHGMIGTEVRSTHGDSPLGHVFPDGPRDCGLRYCINSAALRFMHRDDMRPKVTVPT